MRRTIFVLLLIQCSVLISYCSKNNNIKNEKHESTTQNASSDSIVITKVIIPITHLNEDQKLLLINQIPIGSSYSEISEIFNDISELKVEHSTNNLNEATATVKILGYNASIEFNFKGKSVYSYYYKIKDLEKNTADSLYLFLQNFYTEHYGSFSEEKETESSASSSVSSFWKLEKFSVSMTKNIYPDFVILAWGYQKPGVQNSNTVGPTRKSKF